MCRDNPFASERNFLVLAIALCSISVWALCHSLCSIKLYSVIIAVRVSLPLPKLFVSVPSSEVETAYTRAGICSFGSKSGTFHGTSPMDNITFFVL